MQCKCKSRFLCLTTANFCALIKDIKWNYSHNICTYFSESKTSQNIVSYANKFYFFASTPIMQPRLRICCAHIIQCNFFSPQIKSKRATYAEHLKMLARYYTVAQPIHKIRRHWKEEAPSSAQQLQSFAIMLRRAKLTRTVRTTDSRMEFENVVYTLYLRCKSVN